MLSLDCFGDAQALVDDDAADLERVVERLFQLTLNQLSIVASRKLNAKPYTTTTGGTASKHRA